MRLVFAYALVSVLAGLGALAPAVAAPCGGSFDQFVDDLKSDASARGLQPTAIDGFFFGVRQDPKVLRADRAQGVFQKPFVDFARRLISADRMARGQRFSERYDRLFTQIERDYGVSRGVLLAFWAFETDFGGFQGDFNTRDALVTLAHDCRRPELFRPQVFAAIDLSQHGLFDAATTTGAWAGEIGQVQMLPGDILAHGRDGDGDGRVDLKGSSADALVSGADLLASFGGRRNEPWLHQVTMPANFDWEQTGLDTRLSVAQWQKMGVRGRGVNLPKHLKASLIVPQGHRGPAFLAYHNFHSLFEWNQSFVYVTTAAYFATRLTGAPVFDGDNATAGLPAAQMKQLQSRLQKMGHDVGKIDGILGAKTRRAVQHEQARLGLVADAWPTTDLLDRLQP
jgi:lytic murein transglycosylase